MMKYLKKNRRRIITAVGMLAVAAVSAGCAQHVSLAENTEQPEVWLTQNLDLEETTEQLEEESIGIQDLESSEEVTETTPEETTETTPELETGTPKITPKETETVYDGVKEDAFFKNSVFIGDSVMMGFRNYILRQEEGFMGSPEFLVSGSYSLRMALNPVSSTTIHPVYQGEQQLIWDAIKMLGVDKAFIALGLNDIGMLSVESTYENYQKVLASIYEVNPDISVYIISTTNIYDGSEVGDLNNENVRLLNQKMKNYCAGSKEEFIDIADYLIDENGCLKEEYCSDNYVHQTSAAYDIWVQVLREFASKHQDPSEQSEVPSETSAADMHTEEETKSNTEAE